MSKPTLTREQIISLAEAKSLAQQAASIIAELIASPEQVRVGDAIGGALWRLTDAAGLVLLIAGGENKPTGRGFIVADVYKE